MPQRESAATMDWQKIRYDFCKSARFLLADVCLALTPSTEYALLTNVEVHVWNRGSVHDELWSSGKLNLQKNLSRETYSSS